MPANTLDMGCTGLWSSPRMNECLPADEGYDIPHPLWDSKNRQKTFNAWYNPFVNIESLASAGFIYVGPGDKVKCVFCYLFVDTWLCGDDPFRKHVRLKPNCSHIKYLQEEEVPELQFAISNQPALPSYQSLDVRKRSFENWPRDNPIRPDDLAEAGFFYTKRGDRVQCFFCRLYVEGWEPSDDVYVEHCRLNPNCGFMIMKKGKIFSAQCSPGACATEPSTEPSDPVSNLRRVQIMKDALSFQGVNKVYSDCAFLQQRIRRDPPFESTEALFNAIMRLPRAQEAAAERSKDPNKTNAAEIALMKTCKTCLQRECEYMCFPCKHLTCCTKCIIDFPECPICEQRIHFVSIDMQNLVQELLDLDL